jgi:microcystin-dependent protein
LGATFSRLKNWTTEVLTYSDLNNEIDNILDNLDPAGAGDYSASSAQMRLNTDPGEAGSESLPTSLAGELERLRFAIKEMKGSDVSYWYETADTSLTELRTVLAGAINPNYISSGKESSRSSQLIALVPSGTTASVTLDAAPTAFVAYIDGTQYSVTADVTITGLSLAPSAGNTCLVNDTAATSQYHRYLGQYGSLISVDNMGTAMTTLVGKTTGFKIVSGGSTEYFLGYVNSATEITKTRRGYFYNSSQNAIPSINFADNNTISLVRPAWVFLNTSSSMVVTYNLPTYSGSQPSSPTTGDYWYDIANGTWKTFNSVTWVSANATLIGMTLQDTAACVAARTFDQKTALNEMNTVDLERVGATQVQVKNYGARCSVFGTDLSFEMFRPVWDITADLDTGISESASTNYYFYLKESGVPVMSDVSPLDRKGDLLGFYHPTETWRCVGSALNDGSSNFSAATVVAFSRSKENGIFSNDDGLVGDTKMLISETPSPGWLECNGAALSRNRYNELFAGHAQAMGTACGTSTTYLFELPDSRGRFPRFWNHGAGYDPDAATRAAMAAGGNTADSVGSLQTDNFQSHAHQVKSDPTGGNLVGSTVTSGENCPVGFSNFGANANAEIIWASGDALADGGGGTPRTASETRPRNFALLLAIKVLR